jgi:hypothetical protein
MINSQQKSVAALKNTDLNDIYIIGFHTTDAKNKQNLFHIREK